MTLSYNETKMLVELILDRSRLSARDNLHNALTLLKRSEGEFYAGIAKHRKGLGLTTEQWFELLSRLPNRILRSQIDLENILSEEQIKKLPPTTG